MYRKHQELNQMDKQYIDHLWMHFLLDNDSNLQQRKFEYQDKGNNLRNYLAGNYSDFNFWKVMLVNPIIEKIKR